MNKSHNDAGQALVVVALAMVVLLGFMALGIDMGYLRYVRRQVQMAADAAAIAGAKEIHVCKGVTPCTAVTTAGLDAVSNDNKFPSVTASTSCTPTPGLGATEVTVKYPPACGGSNDPNNGNTYFVEAVVAEQVPTLFAKELGMGSSTISARAEVQGVTNCIYGLNTTGNPVYALIATVNSACGVVSNANIYATGACISAPSIDMVGSVSGFFGLCNGFFGGKSTSPSPPTKIPAAVADPLAGVLPPAISSACVGITQAPKVITGPGTFAIPNGAYCGGITISGGAVVNFTGGGTYVIGGGTNNPSPGLSIAQGSTVNFGPIGSNQGYQIDGGIKDGGSTINFNTGCASTACSTASLFVLYGGGLNLGVSTGSFATKATGYGVTFYNTGSGPGGCATCYGTVNDIFAINTELSAPTSGTFAGILFFQDRNNPQPATFAANFSFGAGTAATTGGYYFPDAQVNFDFDFGNAAEYTFLIADDIEWLVSFTFNNNYTHLPGQTSILPVGQAALIE
jgi:Flp pilus assembly protein TadG